MKRRNFVVGSITAGLALGLNAKADIFRDPDSDKQGTAIGKKILNFGMLADLHQDIIPDGPRRLDAFIKEMNLSNPDFIIQLGDFCQPRELNKPLIDKWKEFKGKGYHVIGNHDTDDGFTLQQVVDFWEAKSQYYSFDVNGYHFIVLNANEEKDLPNYNGPTGIITDAQKLWLQKDLELTKFPVIVFCHQGIDNDAGGVYIGNAIRVLFERANVQAGYKKVRLVFSGHHHQDYYNVINEIHYVQINSMSYQWMGAKFASSHYNAEIEKKYPVTKYIAPYQDPLWCTVTIYEHGIRIKGKKSSFIKPTPDDLKRPEFHAGYPDVPYISDRIIKF